MKVEWLRGTSSIQYAYCISRMYGVLYAVVNLNCEDIKFQVNSATVSIICKETCTNIVEKERTAIIPSNIIWIIHFLLLTYVIIIIIKVIIICYCITNCVNAINLKATM